MWKLKRVHCKREREREREREKRSRMKSLERSSKIKIKRRWERWDAKVKESVL